MANHKILFFSVFVASFTLAGVALAAGKGPTKILSVYTGTPISCAEEIVVRVDQTLTQLGVNSGGKAAYGRLNELEQIVLKAGSNRERAQALSQAMSHLRTLCSQNESLWFIDDVFTQMEKNSEIFLALTSADSAHAGLASSSATFVDGDKILLVAPVSTPTNPTEWGISNIASLSVAAAFYNFSRWMKKSHENESFIRGSAGPLYKKFRGSYQGEWPVLLSGDRADLALVLGAMMQAVTTVNLLGLVRANNIDANKNHQWQSFYQNVAWSPNRLEIVEKLGITRANFYQRSAQILDEMRTSIYARPSNN